MNFIIFVIICMTIFVETRLINSIIFYKFYIKKFSKSYSILEYIQKFKIFRNELKLFFDYQFKIEGKIFSKKIPYFLDKSDQDFKKLLWSHDIKYLYNFKEIYYEEIKNQITEEINNQIPEEFDYSKTSRSYDNCSSCWAISIIESIEGQLFLKKGLSILLSVQQLIDCNSYGSCNGGYIIDAIKYLIENKMSIQRNDDYPYDDKKGNCKYESQKGMTKITNFSYYNINNINEDSLKNILYSNGPLIITINASTWKYYIDGIYQPTSKSCNPSQINHAVLLVGFGIDNGVKFWKIKNNWGPLWGESGYIRIIRGINACGILSNIYLSNIEN